MIILGCFGGTTIQGNPHMKPSCVFVLKSFDSSTTSAEALWSQPWNTARVSKAAFVCARRTVHSTKITWFATSAPKVHLWTKTASLKCFCILQSFKVTSITSALMSSKIDAWHVMIGGVQKSTYWTCRMSFPSKLAVYYCHRSRQFQLGWSFHPRSSLACLRAIFYLALAAIRCILHLKVQDSQGGGLSWACMFRYWLEIQPLNTLGFDLQDSVQDLDMIKGNWDLNQPFGCSGTSKPNPGGVWDTQKQRSLLFTPLVFSVGCLWST